jgi:hypothetical protein
MDSHLFSKAPSFFSSVAINTKKPNLQSLFSYIAVWITDEERSLEVMQKARRSLERLAKQDRQRQRPTLD